MSNPLSYVEISKAAFQHNVEYFRSLIPKSTKLIAVVKANAYGHGLKETVQSLEKIVDFFQVDDIEELTAIRKYTNAPVLVYGYVNPAETKTLLSLSAIAGVFSVEHLKAFNDQARILNCKLPLHLALDTNFGREGITFAEIDQFLEALKTAENISFDGAYSHFTCADCDPDQSITNKQLSIFNDFLIKLPKNIFTSTGATAGALNFAQARNYSAVRIGKGLYGGWPNSSTISPLKTPLTWKSTVVQIKEVPNGTPIGYGATYITDKATTLALLPQGYSDRINRMLSNKGSVLIRGTHCPIRGRVSMNMTVVDITHLSDARVGDEVVIIGVQGNNRITQGDLAGLIGTIDYEVMTGVSAFLPRILV